MALAAVIHNNSTARQGGEWRAVGGSVHTLGDGLSVRRGDCFSGPAPCAAADAEAESEGEAPLLLGDGLSRGTEGLAAEAAEEAEAPEAAAEAPAAAAALAIVGSRLLVLSAAHALRAANWRCNESARICRLISTTSGQVSTSINHRQRRWARRD